MPSLAQEAQKLPQPAVQFFGQTSSDGFNEGSSNVFPDPKLAEGIEISPNPGVPVSGVGKVYKEGAIVSAPPERPQATLISFNPPEEFSPEAVSRAGGISVAFWMDASKGFDPWTRILGGLKLLDILMVGEEPASVRLRPRILEPGSGQTLISSPEQYIDLGGWAFYTLIVPVDGPVRFFRNGHLEGESSRPLFVTFDQARHSLPVESDNLAGWVRVGGNDSQAATKGVPFSNVMIFTGALGDDQVKALFEKQFQ